MRPERPSLGDVAKHANVSVSTASRVINGRSGVDWATRSAVWDAVRTLGYEVVRTPDVLSGVLVVAPWVSFGNTYWQLVVSGILDEASRSSLPVTFSSAATAEEAKREIRSLMSRDGVLGVILACFPTHVPAADWLPQEPEAVAVSVLMKHDGNTVDIDTYRAVYEVTRRLCELGHERIAFAINSGRWWSPQQRIKGFQDAVAKHGSGNETGAVQWVSLDRVGEWLPTLFEGPDRPTAIVGGTTELSRLIFAELGRMGVQVPKELSFAGVGHIRPWDETPFDAVLQPSFELGAAAVRALRSIVARPDRTVRERLAAQVVLVGTTSPPRVVRNV